MTDNTIQHWADVLVRLTEKFIHDHFVDGPAPNQDDYRAQMISVVCSIATAERDGISASAARFGILRQVLIDHGCPWPEGGHIPTFVGTWLESLQSSFRGTKNDRPESRTV